MQRGRDVGRKDAGGFEAENRTKALAASKHAVAHGLVNGRWRRGFAGKQTLGRSVYLQTVFFKKWRKLYSGGGVERRKRCQGARARSRVGDGKAQREAYHRRFAGEV